MMHHIKQRPGYIFLVSILSIGAVCAATSATLLLLAWSAEQSGLLLVQSSQAYEYAYSCAERALGSLHDDIAYAGNETFTYDYGTCDILPIVGSGNADRAVCVVGYDNNVIRRMQIDIAEVIPSVRIRTWEEAVEFTLCP